MLKLPKNTEFNKRIPKQKLYENLDIAPSLKKSFIDDIDAIYWRNKISKDTINLEEGEEVKEIQVFLIELKKEKFDENILLQIDRQIPYHIVYILKFDDRYKLAIGYKEESLSGSNHFKVTSYYYSEWMNKNDLDINIRGLNLDKVYENLLIDIGEERLEKKPSEDISKAVARDKKVQEINKKIDKLIKKRKKTKQLKKQMKINDEIRMLKSELKKI